MQARGKEFHGIYPSQGAARSNNPATTRAEALPGRFAVVAIGSSAGGIQALRRLVSGLPDDFPLPILVCQHVHRDKPSRLPEILARCTGLRAVAGAEGDRPSPGTIHVAPPNRHLRVRPDGLLGLSDGERVNHCRPAANVLFRTVAQAYGAQAVSVVLTGYGRDGALGSRAIQGRGGLAIAQDEASTEVFEMPLAARDLGRADLVVSLGRIAAALEILARQAEDAAPPHGEARVRPGEFDGGDRAQRHGRVPLCTGSRRHAG